MVAVAQAGTEALFRYRVAGPALWHKRIWAAHVEGKWWIVITQDSDVYLEQLERRFVVEFVRMVFSWRGELSVLGQRIFENISVF